MPKLTRQIVDRGWFIFHNIDDNVGIDSVGSVSTADQYVIVGRRGI